MKHLDNPTQSYWRPLLLLVFLSMTLWGCSSQQPLPHAARAGETLVVSLGSTDRNALVPVLKKENITVTITDVLSTTHTAKVRYVFRVYPDPSSAYATRSQRSGGFVPGYANYVDPHQGLWFAVIDLIDPASDWQNPMPLALTAGMAALTISSPDLVAFVDYPGYGWPWTNGNLNSIPVEILAGTGTPNPLNYLQPVSAAPMANLEPNPQVVVTPTGTPGGTIGGAQFTFSYISADFGAGKPIVVPVSPDPNIQLASHRIDQGDGTSRLRIVMVNPHGFATDNNKIVTQNNQSLFRGLSFAIVWDDALINATITDANWQNSLQLVDGEYIEVAGDTMPELTPTLTKAR